MEARREDLARTHGSSGSLANRRFPMRRWWKLSGAPTESKSMPIWAAACSNSASHGPAREIRRIPDDHPVSQGTTSLLRLGFAKSERDNIDDDERGQFKRAAKHVLGLSEQHLAALIRKGQFFEVSCDDKEVPE
jgi:RelE toxin of RelE / RelB toxin-antitoxin system